MYQVHGVDAQGVAGQAPGRPGTWVLGELSMGRAETFVGPPFCNWKMELADGYEEVVVGYYSGVERCYLCTQAGSRIISKSHHNLI